ncbi:uncharacterized protein TM35_000332340, partial [Trypanosoma theileri]
MMIISEFHHFIFYKKNSLTMPDTSTWCQAPVLRIVGGSQEPAKFFFWKTCWPLDYGVIQHLDQQCRGEAEIYPRRSLGHASTCCQRYHPHQVAAEWWWCRGKTRPFTARN